MRHVRNRALFILLLAIVLAGPGLARAQSKKPGNQAIVARVNGRAIPMREFTLAVQMQFRRRPPEQRRHDDLAAVRARALETLIDNELLYQKASVASIEVSEKEIEEELAEVEGVLGSREELEKILGENGVTRDQFREQLRRTLVVVRFVDREVAGEISISDEDVRKYYDLHPDEMKRREGVRIRQIVIPVPPGASNQMRSEARQKVEGILRALRNGEDFSRLAAAHSGGNEARRGGESGVIVRGGALPAVERAAFELQPGEISDIVETTRGFHIIEAIERQTAGVIPFESAQDLIRDQMSRRERQQRLTAYLEQLRGTARIERLLPGLS